MAEQNLPGEYENLYKFNAKELDSETELYYYGARYYNPRLSVWYGVDPLAEKMPNWSPYTYTFDNPVNFVDPDGRAPMDWILKIGSWSYDPNITSIKQAKSATGVTGFAKNGTIVQTSAGYARLMVNNQVHWLPNETANDKVENAMAVMAQFFSGNSASTWDPQVFPQLTNHGGMARSDFDASSWDKFNSGTDKLFNLDMGSLVQPGSLPSGNSFGERFSAFAEGLKICQIFGILQKKINL